METVVQQARTLSSGTIATLIGNSSYDAIDIIRGDFVRFCKVFSGYFNTWQDAWKSYELPGSEYWGLSGIKK